MLGDALDWLTGVAVEPPAAERSYSAASTEDMLLHQTEHLQTLSDLLAEHFDPKRARSLQQQLPTFISHATGTELRRLLNEVLSDTGPSAHTSSCSLARTPTH